jgi:hypothetical protein
MKTIFKYQIQAIDVQEIKAPMGWRPLSVGVQYDAQEVRIARYRTIFVRGS